MIFSKRSHNQEKENSGEVEWQVEDAGMQAPENLMNIEQRLDKLKGIGGALVPIIAAIGGNFSSKAIHDALPHLVEINSLEELQTVLFNLNIASYSKKLKLAEISEEILPLIIKVSEDSIFVVIDILDKGVVIYDCEIQDCRVLEFSNKKYDVFLLTAVNHTEESKKLAVVPWALQLYRSFSGIFRKLFFMAFFSSLVSLVPPFYMMAVYDKVIGTQSLTLLGYLFSIVLVFLICEYCIIIIKAKINAYMSTRAELLISETAFKKTLSLPVNMTESSSQSSQIIRLQSFEAIKELFGGGLMLQLIEIPFVLIYGALIFVIAGLAVVVPIIAMIIFIALAFLVKSSVAKGNSELSRSRSKKQEFIYEMMHARQLIRASNSEKKWGERFSEINREHAMNNFKLNRLNVRYQNLFNFLVMSTGMGTVYFSTIGVVEGSVSMGALIAIITLVWKFLKPIQNLILSLAKFEQIKSSMDSFNRYLQMENDNELGQLPTISRKFEGKIEFLGVSFRYKGNVDPVLANFSMVAKPGSVVAITGSCASGKTSVINLISGIHSAQSGLVLIDGTNIAHMNKNELRSNITVLTQIPILLYGTLEQNIRLCEPSATKEDVEAVIKEANLQHEIDCLPEGVKTRLTSEKLEIFSLAFRQKISLARVLISKSKIILIDQPENYLGMDSDEFIITALNKFKGEKTVIFTSYRPNFIRHADQAIYLDRGQIVKAGTPSEIIPLLVDKPIPVGMEEEDFRKQEENNFREKIKKLRDFMAPDGSLGSSDCHQGSKGVLDEVADLGLDKNNFPYKKPNAGSNDRQDLDKNHAPSKSPASNNTGNAQSNAGAKQAGSGARANPDGKAGGDGNGEVNYERRDLSKRAFPASKGQAPNIPASKGQALGVLDPSAVNSELDGAENKSSSESKDKTSSKIFKKRNRPIPEPKPKK